MLVVFPSISVADTKLILDYNFVASKQSLNLKTKLVLSFSRMKEQKTLRSFLNHISLSYVSICRNFLMVPYLLCNIYSLHKVLYQYNNFPVFSDVLGTG